MNEDGTPIEAGAAGAAEGANVPEATADEVAEMYKSLGIEAPAPTGATKGRPKSSTVRAKDAKKDDDGDSKSERKDDDDSKVKPKDAPVAAKNGDAGDAADSKTPKDGAKDGEVQDESDEADKGVRDPKPGTEKDAKPGSEGDAKPGDDGVEDDDESEESEEGKRPGKSNPKVEQRFQKLTTDVRERDEEIERLRTQLEETTKKQREAQVAQEDPEYTIEDFKKVRNDAGEILDLDDDRAELAWRRWQEGYNQRQSERQAKEQHEAAQAQRQQEASDQVMADSVEAYDKLTSLMDEYPELVETSGKFDSEFAAIAMPIIKNAIIYKEGTEPGNEAGEKPVILGMRIDPKIILDGMSKIKSAKRGLPLNGVNDNVEVRSNVTVPHSGRSSDPTINAANDLYKTLNINKRF